MVRSTPLSGQTETGAVSERVVHAVAEARDVDPLDLDPLYGVVDPDALDRLFAANAGPDRTIQGRVVFGMAGCEVTVYSDGRVDVDAHSEPRVDATAVDSGPANGEAETFVGE